MSKSKEHEDREFLKSIVNELMNARLITYLEVKNHLELDPNYSHDSHRTELRASKKRTMTVTYFID